MFLWLLGVEENRAPFPATTLCPQGTYGASAIRSISMRPRTVGVTATYRYQADPSSWLHAQRNMFRHSVPPRRKCYIVQRRNDIVCAGSTTQMIK
jgi:hypothetical protein